MDASGWRLGASAGATTLPGRATSTRTFDGAPGRGATAVSFFDPRELFTAPGDTAGSLHLGALGFRPAGPSPSGWALSYGSAPDLSIRGGGGPGARDSAGRVSLFLVAQGSGALPGLVVPHPAQSPLPPARAGARPGRRASGGDGRAIWSASCWTPVTRRSWSGRCGRCPRSSARRCCWWRSRS